jgi:RimJ/RimL family protein N-acetyltransferase
MALVPASFVVPERLETARFRLRKLTARDADIDYRAVMANLGLIQRTRGGDWPTPALTFEEDRADLAEHEREFDDRTAFAYIVTSPDEAECLGCVYLYPPGRRGTATEGADVDVSFWVVQAAYDAGLYESLFAALQQWLARWPFRKIRYSNAVLPPFVAAT